MSALNHQRHRMRLCIQAGTALGRIEIVTMARSYLRKLDWYATMPAGDTGHIAGMIGRNGMGPALDDVVRQVRFAQRKARLDVALRAVAEAA